MAHSPSNLIIDDVLGPKGLRDIVEVFTNFDVVFVGVHCPVATLEAREQERDDRDNGLAKSQLPHIHAKAIYDLEVDTEKLSPEDCAARNQSPSWRATNPRPPFDGCAMLFATKPCDRGERQKPKRAALGDGNIHDAPLRS